MTPMQAYKPLTAADIRKNAHHLFQAMPSGRILRVVSAEDNDPSCNLWFCLHADPDTSFWAKASEVHMLKETL